MEEMLHVKICILFWWEWSNKNHKLSKPNPNLTLKNKTLEGQYGEWTFFW